MEDENEALSKYRSRGIYFFFGKEERALFQVIRAFYGQYPYYCKETMKVMSDINGKARFCDIIARGVGEEVF